MLCKIELRGPLSYTLGGVTFKRGKPHVTSDDELIAFARGTSCFHVTDVTRRAPKVRPARVLREDASPDLGDGAGAEPPVAVRRRTRRSRRGREEE
ncbi:MAG: hypothetical protein ACE5FA_09765 [Dehalococcoidia bacterium]